MGLRGRLKLGCGHTLHVRCLTQWAQQGKDTCPLCRQPMDVDSLMAVNKGTIDYIGRVIYSLPSAQRNFMLTNLMHLLDETLRHVVSTPVGQLGVYEDRSP